MRHSLRYSPAGMCVAAFIALALMTACGGEPATPTRAPAPTATALPTQAPSDETWQRIQTAGLLNVGTSLDYPPYARYDPSAQPDGFDIALMREVGRRLGVAVAFSDFAFDGVLGALQLRQVDAAIAALTITPERMSVVDFSQPYYVGEDATLAAGDSPITAISAPTDLAARRVGVQRGSAYETWLQNTLVAAGRMLPSNLLAYTRPEDAVRDLREGRVDLFVLDRLPAQHFAQQGGVKIVASALNPQRLGIATRKDSPALLARINEALTQMQADGTLSRLAQQYLQVNPGDVIDPGVVPTLPPPTPAPPPACIAGMAFVADLSLDDRNMTAPPLMQPGQSFQKGWRIRNSGTCAWPADYVFAYATGNTPAARMGGQNRAIGRVVQPGETLDVYVDLVAPYAPGVYQGFWNMLDRAGAGFGSRVWVGIRVPDPNPPTPLPPVTDIDFRVDRTSITAGECVTFRWNVSNARAVYFYAQGQPYRSFGMDVSGTSRVCPAQTTVYELRVERQAGGSVMRQIRIDVAASPVAPVAQFNSNPEFDIFAGQCVSLWWNIQGRVDRVALVRNGSPLWGNAPANGSYSDCPERAGVVTYELQVFYPGGGLRQQRVIHVREGSVLPAPTPIPPGDTLPAIIRLSASEQTRVGSCVWVSWELGGGTTYARLLKNGRLYGDNAQQVSNIAAYSGNGNGDCDTPAAGVIVYRLEAFNASGQSTAREVTTQVTP